MKKLLPLISLILIFTLALAGCGGGGAETAPDAAYSEAIVPSDIGSDDETGSVSLFDGTWWYRADPTNTGLNIFSFEGNTIVFYEQNGNEVTRGSALDNGDGTFIISLELFGDVVCQIGQNDSSWTITTVDDGAVYLPGAAIDSTEIAGDYTGKWYENGDLSEDYVSLNADGSYGVYTQIGDEDVPRSEGHWQLTDVKSHNEHGRGDYQKISFDQSFDMSSLAITEDGAALWTDDRGDYRYYLKESLIGSPEGEIARQTVSLYCADDWGPEELETDAIFLKFYDDGYITFYILQADGAAAKVPDGGSWKQTEDAFALTLPDGTEYAFVVDGETLTLDDGTMFKRDSGF